MQSARRLQRLLLRLWLLGVSEDQSLGGSLCHEAEVRLDMLRSADCRPTGQTGPGRLDHSFPGSCHHSLLGGSLWGGVLQHVAHLVLSGDLRGGTLRGVGADVQSWASEPAVSALQQKQLVHCCALEASMNVFTPNHL